MNMNQKKRVTFGTQQTAYFADAAVSSSSFTVCSLDTDTAVDDIDDDYKASCWYSNGELQQTRGDALQCILSLQERLNQEGDNYVSISIDALEIPCPNDPSQNICLRGIEKYADAAAKLAGQKYHVGSVLRQQALNNKEEHLASVSRTLSQPFKDVARYYALKSAEEQEALRKQDAEQMDVAQAIVLFLTSQRNPETEHHHQLSSPSDMNLLPDGRSTPPEMVSTSTISKRSREDHEGINDLDSSCNDHNEKDNCATRHHHHNHHHCRNVKPCMRVIISE
jgi:hypothetical protein